MNNNTRKKAKIIQDIVSSKYEPGRQDRCKLWVYRNVVFSQHPMSQSTFFRLLSCPADGDDKNDEDKRQLKLFDE